MLTGSQGFRPNYDGETLSRRAKRTVRWDPGVRKKAKRRFWKYMRWLAKHQSRNGYGYD